MFSQSVVQSHNFRLADVCGKYIYQEMNGTIRDVEQATYQLGYQRYGFSARPNIWHAVDVAVEWIVAWMTIASAAAFSGSSSILFRRANIEQLVFGVIFLDRVLIIDNKKTKTMIFGAPLAHMCRVQ